MKRRAVVYTAEASNDLDWIYDTVADARDPETAFRYEQRIRVSATGSIMHPSAATAATISVLACASSASSGA